MPRLKPFGYLLLLTGASLRRRPVAKPSTAPQSTSARLFLVGFCLFRQEKRDRTVGGYVRPRAAGHKGPSSQSNQRQTKGDSSTAYFKLGRRGCF